jgi:hypothetical protein
MKAHKKESALIIIKVDISVEIRNAAARQATPFTILKFKHG